MTSSVTFIPADLPFLETLAQFLLSKQSAHEIAKTFIFLPTHRACLKFEEVLRQHGPNQTTFLPKLIPLGDLEEEAITEDFTSTYSFSLSFPEVITHEERLSLLTEKIQSFYSQRQKTLKTSQACLLAEQLLRLIDQIQLEGLDFSTIKSLVPEEYALHWQSTVQFLEIIAEIWPKLIQSTKKIEPKERQRRLLEIYAAVWEKSPPSHAVIVAGSTGSIPATRRLLKVVSTLPHGMVVLPGLVPTNEKDLVSTHPQYTMNLFLKSLKLKTSEVLSLCGTVSHLKNKILSNAFESSPFLFSKDEIESNTKHISLVECTHQQEEATIIACAIREILETPKKTVALITADKILAQRVDEELKRWGISANRSSGTPFSKTPLGIFLLLSAQWIQKDMNPITFLGTLKHPYAMSFKIWVQQIEKSFLRKGISLEKALEKENLSFNFLIPLMRKGQELASQPDVAFETLLEFHYQLVKKLTEGRVIGTIEEEKAWDTFRASIKSSTPSLFLKTGEDYSSLLHHFFSLITLRPLRSPHPRVQILGLLEARLIPADLVILGGLNEGSWPGTPPIDPWFSQSMRQKIGLPDHNKHIGLSALDFVQACSAPAVLLTRAKRLQGSPSVPSRFLTRLQSFLQRFNLEIASNTHLLAYIRALDTSSKRTKLLPPIPCPALSCRPKKISITDVTTLMNDPYSFYAKRILQLKQLKPLENETGPLEFGIFVHDILEMFPRTIEEGRKLGLEKFSRYFQENHIQSLWWWRFESILNWFIHETQERHSFCHQWREIAGTLPLAFLDGSLQLIGKADRIDDLGHALSVIDYKTGTIPSKRDMERGLAPQLALEALMIQRGAFETVPQKSLHSLAFWHLTGGKKGGEILEFQEIEELLESSWDGLQHLVQTFYDDSTPYLSIPYQTSLYKDYDHLARIKEWSFNMGEEA